MEPSQDDKLGFVPSQQRPRLTQRLFTRFGTPAILVTVLLVVVAWTGFLGWVAVTLVSRFFE